MVLGLTTAWLLFVSVPNADVDDAATERSLCEIEPLDVPGLDALEIELLGITWEGWSGYCEHLVAFLRDGEGFPDAVATAERLTHSGLFARSRCELVAAGRLRCQLDAKRVVSEVDLRGELPFPLRPSVVESRLGVSLGASVEASEARFDEITSRLVRYLERNGFFGATVRLSTRPVGGAEPAAGFELVVQVTEAAAYELGEVRINGDPIVTAEEARELLSHHWLPGLFPRRVRLEQVKLDVEKIAETLRERGWPATRLRVTHAINSETDALDLVLSVRSGPRLVVRFSGNREVATDDLLEALPFVAGRRVNRSLIATAQDLVRAALQREGFPRAVVSTEEDRAVRDELTLTFLVEEGAAAELTHVEVVGTSGELGGLDGLESKPSGCVSTGRWIDVAIERDRARLEAMLRGAGFAHAQVRVEPWEPAAGELGLRFVVSEGARAAAAGITIEGLPPGMDAEEAVEAVGIVRGAAVDEAVIEEGVRRLRAALMTRGYPDATVSHRARPTGDGRLELTLYVTAGARLSYGGMLSTGNQATARFLLEADLDLTAGDALDLDAIVTYKQRLRERGLFRSVKVTSIPGPAARRWLLTEVEELDYVALDLLIAFSTDDLFSLGAEFSHRNLFGLGLTLEADVSLANSPGLGADWLRIGNKDSANLKLIGARLFGLPFNAELSGSFAHQDKTSFEETEGGGAITLSRVFASSATCRWCPTLGLSLSYEITAASTSLREEGDTPEPDFTVIPRLSPKVVISQLDSVTDPRRGYSLSNLLEIGHPLDGNEAAALVRYFATVTTYFAIGDPVGAHFRFGSPSTARVVIALRGSYGFAEPLAPSTALPTSEALYYGGDNSVRGLPERVSLLFAPEARHLLTANAEVRWYFWDDLWIGDLQLAAFCDFGAVSGPGEFSFDQASLSVGPVLRYATAIGPLSVGYGIPVLRPTDGEALIPAEGRVHVTFGAAF